MASTTTTHAPPASRNAPCPCGSGRRYKDCHGRAMMHAGPVSDVAMRLHDALAAQQAGRIDEAIAIYDGVIVDAPSLFDAWHMRGVAHFQAFDFDAAERDIRRAIALEPAIEAVRLNLALVLQGRTIAQNEIALCRAVLPRFAALAVDPPVAPLDGVSAGTRVFVLDALGHATLADAIAREAEHRGAVPVRIAVEAGRAIDGADAAALASTGAADVVVCVGTTRPFGDWTLAAGARATALVADGNDLPAFVDRLREVSGQGRRAVRVALAHGAPLDLAPIPHVRCTR